MKTDSALDQYFDRIDIDSSEVEIGSSVIRYDKKGWEDEKETGASQVFLTSEREEKADELTVDMPLTFRPRGLSALEIKDINRFITRKISPKFKEQLIEERNSLVDRKFNGGLSRKEERRLTYVRWQLDRIDDAEEGHILDYFEKVAEQHENFSKEITNILDRLNL